MNWPYIHTLINHFPIILTVVGAAVLLAALIWRNRGLWLYAVATLTLSGLSAYPAHFTGDQAAHSVRTTWYVVRAMVEKHDESAGPALVSLLIMGLIAAYTWWRMLKREPGLLPPVWLRTLLALATAAALAFTTYAAYLGGQIVHESPRLAAPPAGPVPVPVP